MATHIIRQLMQGRVTKEQYKTYLMDVYSYALHSSVVIGIAATRMVHSHPPLSEYLFRHAGEELGHDRWAASDLRDLGMSENEIDSIQPSSPCARMIALEYYYAAHANPVGLFGWMFVLESLGGKIGGDIADGIDKVLALNGKATYFLKGHAEADAHHSEDLFVAISENMVVQEDKIAFETMVSESLDLYAAILDNAWHAREVEAA